MGNCRRKRRFPTCRSASDRASGRTGGVDAATERSVTRAANASAPHDSGERRAAVAADVAAEVSQSELDVDARVHRRRAEGRHSSRRSGWRHRERSAGRLAQHWRDRDRRSILAGRGPGGHGGADHRCAAQHDDQREARDGASRSRFRVRRTGLTETRRCSHFDPVIAGIRKPDLSSPRAERYINFPLNTGLISCVSLAGSLSYPSSLAACSTEQPKTQTSRRRSRRDVQTHAILRRGLLRQQELLRRVVLARSAEDPRRVEHVGHLERVRRAGRGWRPRAAHEIHDELDLSDLVLPERRTRILYSSDEGGNELSHLYVRTPDGSVKDITPGTRIHGELRRAGPVTTSRSSSRRTSATSASSISTR